MVTLWCVDTAVVACSCVAGTHPEQTGKSSVLMACSNGHLDLAQWLIDDMGVAFRSERNRVCYVFTWGPQGYAVSLLW